MREYLKEEAERMLYPFMKGLFYRISRSGEDFSIDGVWAYNENAQFVGGKMINLCSYVVTELMEGEEYQKGMALLPEIIARAASLPMKTWGILNAITGIFRLEQKGILEKAAEPEVLEKLQRELDWRKFIDCENNLALMDLPTNYYGVAFGVARYRELLGWDQEGCSERLLKRFLEHIEAYSGEYEFMDETQGQGRFDRYSILVPAELTGTILRTKMVLPEKIKSMLRKSADIALKMRNRQGLGFSYGRSTGAYGDTGAWQILTAAAQVPGLLSQEEERQAYTYCVCILNRFGDFWIDEEMDSVNLWEKGRKTDNYRNKNRILSENLSLCMQFADELWWKNPGCDEKTMEAMMEAWEAGPLAGTFFPFAMGEYQRGLAIVRDKGKVWSLPLISGGDSYYAKSPYFPIPYRQFAVTGIPEATGGSLVPVLVLKDGRRAVPTVYIQDIQYQQEKESFRISYRQDRLCVISGEKMEALEGICSETVYTWKSGEIIREDTFFGAGLAMVTGAEMEFFTFSAGVKEIQGGFRAEAGQVRQLTAVGYTSHAVWPLEDSSDFATPDGPLKYRIKWTGARPENGSLKVSWKMSD